MQVRAPATPSIPKAATPNTAAKAVRPQPDQVSSCFNPAIDVVNRGSPRLASSASETLDLGAFPG
jgi:hypothetical protein